MKICMTNNVFPSGPGIAYGGERIVHYLTEALANRGHEIDFFSREGTVPPSNVKSFTPVPEMRDDYDVYFDTALFHYMGNKIKWDIYQTNYFGNGYNPSVKDLAEKTCELVWNRWCHKKPFFDKEPEATNIISYSSVLQDDLLQTGIKSTMIHYGLPKDLYQFEPDHENYAVFIGKLEGGKNPEAAIKLAKAAGIKIVIIGPPYNTGTFWKEVCPHIDNEKVFWVRGASDEQKKNIMSKAKCFISSNDSTWKEHAGIVNMEALAMGVPIIAFNRIGQESAIWQDRFIIDGIHGYFLNYKGTGRDDEIIELGVPLIQKIDKINRQNCRFQFEQKFTADLMAERYEYFYKHILENGDVDSLEIPF